MSNYTVRPGFWLVDRPPAQRQFKDRGKTPKPVIVLHTAESGTHFGDSQDPKAQAVAGFIERRTSYGSYHIIVDKDSIIPLVPYGKKAYGDATGSNSWAFHVSVAMNADDWPKLSTAERDAYLETLVEACNMINRWLESKNLPKVASVRLNKKGSNSAKASGFISHGDRDPGRRHDPGDAFPWDLFLQRYSGTAGAEMPTTTPSKTETLHTNKQNLQKALGVVADGDIGPKSRKALSLNWCGYHPYFDTQVVDKLRNKEEVVRWTQQRLNVLYGADLKEDGKIGKDTAHAYSVFLKPGGIVAGDSFAWLTRIAD